MADIVLSVDFSTLKQAEDKLKALKAAVKSFPVNALASGLSGLEGKIKQLVDAQSKGTIGAKQYNLGLLDIKRAYEQLGLSSQQATARVRAYAAELQRQAAAKEAARAARELARAQEEAARATAQLAARQQELRLRFQDGYAVFARQRKELRDLREAYRSNIISLEQYRAKVQQIRTLSVNPGNTASSNARGVAIQQIGYQVGDFAVQVQSGTNVMVAFGQQATQLVGFLPLMATEFGLTAKAALAWSAGLGIAIPVLTGVLAYFMRTAEAGKTLKETLDELKTSVQDVNEISKAYSAEGLQDLVNKYGEVTEGVLGLIEAQRQLAIAEATAKTSDMFQKLNSELRTFAYTAEQNLMNIFDIPLEEAESLEYAIRMAAKATTFEEQAAALASIRQRLESVSSGLDLADSRQRAMYQSVVSAEDAMRQLAASAPKASWMDAAISGVASLGATIRARIGEAIKLATLANAPGMTTGNLDWAKNELGFILPGKELLNLPKPPKETGGSGGGSGGSTIDPMEKLLKQIERQRELLALDQQQIALKKELWRIEDALGESAGKYSTEKLTAIAKENLAIEAQLKLQEEQQRAMDNLANTMAQSVGDAFMSIVDGTSSVKDAFKQMAADIIKQLLQVLVVQRLVGSWDRASGVGSGLAGFFGKLLGFEGGGYTGSGSRSGGLDGKGGFLAMVHPDETIIDHTKRKQVAPAAKPASVGSSESPVVVHQYFNLSANGDDSVRRIVKEEAPKLAQQAKAAVLDARRRGGSYGKAF